MPSDHDQMLERMRRLPDRIQRLIADESDDDLKRAGIGGSWGAVEHIAHLKDFDDVSLDRVERILQDDDPELDIFDTDVRAIERDYHAEDPRQSAEEFDTLRSMLVNRLESLSEDDWQRTARHPELGSISIESLIQRLDEHDAQHYRALKDVIV
jgi:hypothetical protein